MKQINVVVKKQFLDKYTGKVCKEGTKLTFPADRVKEINRDKKRVEKIETKTAEVKAEIKK